MNIYDFDDTIYDGDTFIEITLFYLKYHPLVTIKSIVKSIPYYFKYKNGRVSFEKLKETFLSFIFKIKNKEDFIEKFINKNIHKIKPWYLEQQKEDDVIISASLTLWIKPFCNKIGINNVIATDTDENGKIIGKSCKREEKVRKLKEQFPNIKVNNAYSDSESDIPMLMISKNPYIVEGNKILKYTENYKFKRKR